jgi:hypothetical protein
MDMSLQLVTERAAAGMMAVSVAALRRWRREHRGPEFVRCERCVRYDIRAIERFLAENCSSKQDAANLESAISREVRREHAAARR